VLDDVRDEHALPVDARFVERLVEHRPGRADEWLLYVQDSPSAQGARGLGIGRIYSRDGVLVASVAQEGMLRVPR
jgi:acyl-CoA thioesterase II